ncbi:hypothetical protein [Marinitoga sp. 38H-ov]|uniref:hypothetical protein n=1 Tax=Marinitoga sp. 38H-ov TaxID=1755814 RepID=UPI0013ED8011|nr:hypothetical protein [Marinitoga sp. 38H-ov]KAF2955367.1 hypothetical protein AS160_10675 [Marinitoga sp. 38H-ov]
MKRFYLVILIINIFLYSFGEKIPIFKENNFLGYLNTSLNESLNEEIINGYWLDLKEIDSELNYFVLGTLNSYDLIFEFSRELGSQLKEKGYDFIVFGNLKTLKKGNEDFLSYISSSPFIASQVIFIMLRGFETSGIFPIVYLGEDFDENIKKSLDQKAGKIFYLSSIKYTSYMFYDKITNKIILNESLNPKLFWDLPKNGNINDIINKIYNNSIVITGWLGENYKLYYRDLPQNSKEKSIIYFSKKVEYIIRDFIEKNINIVSGKKNWDW